MKSKKAQMKIQQMAFMLIAVMIFFALVGLLILTIGFSGLKEKATALGFQYDGIHGDDAYQRTEQLMLLITHPD